MFKKGFLIIFVLACVSWLIYIPIDILSKKNEYNPEQLFSFQDESVLAILNPKEIAIQDIEEYQNSANIKTVSQFNSDNIKELFISKVREHMLIIGTNKWDEKQLNTLLPNAKIKYDKQSLMINDYHGRFKENKLYLYTDKVVESAVETQPKFLYDIKASAAIIRLTKDLETNYTDIYVKNGQQLNYITHSNKSTVGNKVSDYQIFASVTTSNFDTYHFLERDYYSAEDDIFASSPIFSWIQNGMVILTSGNKTAIITDYIEGQDPILILNDYSQTIDTNKFKIPLTRDFPRKGESYTVKRIEDLVVISESTSFCDQIIADYRLGNTIASSSNRKENLYSELPKYVSERYFDSKISFSKSIYKTKTLETRSKGTLKNTTVNASNKAIMLSCGFDVYDFEVLEGIGNVIALGVNGEVARFSNSKLSWMKKLNEKPQSKINIIDLHENGEKHILFNTKDNINCLSLSGEQTTGFPVKLEEESIGSVKFYRWKGNGFFLIATKGREVAQFDVKGRELMVFKTQIDVTEPIQVWASQGQLFGSFSGKAKFQMFAIESKRKYREFDLPNNALSAKFSNELFHFGISNSKLVRYDQKGRVHTMSTYNNGEILSIIEQKGSPIILIKQGDEIKLSNNEGIDFGSIKLPFNDFGHIDVKTSSNGRTIIAVINDLENNVYLYSSNGKLLNSNPLEGQTKVALSFNSEKVIVSSIIDQFIVQYQTLKL